MAYYHIPPIEQRQDEHLCFLVYRLSKNHTLLKHDRPRVHVRGRNKIKFRYYMRTYTKYLKSPLARGTSLRGAKVDHKI